jgi:oligopeptidase B
MLANYKSVLFIIFLTVLAACKQSTEYKPMKKSLYPPPPVAAAKPDTFTEFGHTRVDPYFWLKDRNNQEVIAYLNDENAYCDEVMKPTEELQTRLFDEMKARIKEDDQTVPVRRNGYFYYSRTRAGSQYPIYYRKQSAEGSPEEVLFDINEMASGQMAFLFGDYAVSPDNNWAAYTYNTTGSFAEFNLKIRNLSTGQDLEEDIPGVQGFAWAADSHTLFYTIASETLRPFRVLRHVKGSLAADAVVYEEPDEKFNVDIDKSITGDYLIINTSSFTTSEVRILEAYNPNGSFRIFFPRRQDVRYDIEHHKERFYIRYRDKENKNGMVYSAPLTGYEKTENWKTVVPHDPSVRIQTMMVFENHLVLYVRKDGLSSLRFYGTDGSRMTPVAFPEPVYVVYPGTNPEYTQEKFRYTYSSLNRPATVYDIHMDDLTSETLKVQEIPSGFDPEDYTVERAFATSHDGAQVPMAMVYRKGLQKNSNNPALLYGYGSYGSNTDAHFRPSIFSLIDRGFVYAIAQVRGGSEMGEQWYEDGKLMHKKNTFEDFIACAQHLTDKGYTRPEKLGIMGGSAGGLLVAAAVNMRPDLFGAVVAAVPFVDVVNTMSDESLPLTTQEYEQWGNPNEETAYRYILSYSPYDNIVRANYPHILATAGLNDSQVLFHEPAKWVARLRTHSGSDNIILLKTNMESGHGGATGRYDMLKEVAFEFAFLLRTLTNPPN